MPTCPKGHESVAADYCDECGAPIGGSGTSAGTPGGVGSSRGTGTGQSAVTGSPAGAVTPDAAGATGNGGGSCPECGTPRAGRFCEVCGHDFLLEGLAAATPAGTPSAGTPAPTPDAPRPDATQPAPDPAQPAGAPEVGGSRPPATQSGAMPSAATPDPAPERVGSAPGGSATGSGRSAAGAPATGNASAGNVSSGGVAAGNVSTGGVATDTAGETGTLPRRPSAAGTWRVLVSADPAYHERMRSTSAPDAEDVPLPAFCPERRFALGSNQALIGRRSRSRGIEPDIDLTGPPEDAGVSHAHALLLVGADGGWNLVDLGSANGTYLNDGMDPIEANTPVALHEGDRIHVGAWTTLTLQRS